MDHATRLDQLGKCLAGVFQNRQQALADPAWFVHLRLWIYPIALFAEDSHTFFLEQASAAFAQPPYRQRLLRIRWLADNLTAEYYALKQPIKFQGAAQAPERLTVLSKSDLQPLVGSCLQVTSHLKPSSICFEARHYPGEHCQFIIDGQTKYVQLAFYAVAPEPGSLEKSTFLMADKGIDPNTGKATWGALNGPFRLEKVEDLSSNLNLLKT